MRIQWRPVMSTTVQLSRLQGCGNPSAPRFDQCIPAKNLARLFLKSFSGKDRNVKEGQEETKSVEKKEKTHVMARKSTTSK